MINAMDPYSYHKHSWFDRLTQSLLDSDPRVTSQLKTVPYPGSKPKYIRASIIHSVYGDPIIPSKTYYCVHATILQEKATSNREVFKFKSLTEIPKTDDFKLYWYRWAHNE